MYAFVVVMGLKRWIKDLFIYRPQGNFVGEICWVLQTLSVPGGLVHWLHFLLKFILNRYLMTICLDLFLLTWLLLNTMNYHNTHTMDILWEKFNWILPLYMKPINFQSKASVVFSVTTAQFIDFCLKKLNLFSQHVGAKKKWISELHRKNHKELKR